MKFRTVVKTTPVVGTSFHPEAMALVNRYPDQTKLVLWPEPDNEYDPNALAVKAAIDEQGTYTVGYLPKELSKRLKETFPSKALAINTLKALMYQGQITGFRVEVLCEYNTDMAENDPGE